MITILSIYLRLFLIDFLFAIIIYVFTRNIVVSIAVSTSIELIVIYAYLKLKVKNKFRKIKKAYKLLGEIPQEIEVDGIKFRDLNNNGILDVYEDHRRPIDERVDDLLSKMNVEEKVGLLFNHFTFVTDADNLKTKDDFIYDTYPEEMMLIKNMNSFTMFGGTNTPKNTAKITNKLQEIASRTRLGIPVTIASDPRHHFDARIGFGAAQKGISTWPEQLGLAATRDMQIIKKFAEIVKKEYRAQGLHMILGPVADIATSPMWGRNYNTFGEDSELSAQMIAESILHMQGGKQISKDGILCQVKHFPGGGSQKEGWDSHFPYGREQIYPTNNFDAHLEPFKKAIENGVAQIMPYYSIPEKLKIKNEMIEEVGFNFNHQIITKLLREELNFKGVIGTDFSIIEGTKIFGFNLMFPKSWGVERLSYRQRIIKAFDAGIDQLGGETCHKLLLKIVRKNQISEERIDQSCQRILADKFRLGLFDDPFVDIEKADKICGSDEFVNAGKNAQRKSLVLLKNQPAENSTTKILPLKDKLKIYCENISDAAISKYGEKVSNLEEADIAIIRKNSPHKQQYRYIYEKLFKQGRLNFNKKEEQRLVNIMQKVPTILDISLDRPIVLQELNNYAQAITGHYGCNEDIFLEMIFGEFSPSGKLSMALPKSMECVDNHKVDIPLNEDESLYRYGFGLTYDNFN